MAPYITIIRCSEYEYLILRQLYRFPHTNISCPNQGNLFEDNYRIYGIWNYTHTCSETEKILYVRLYTINARRDTQAEQKLNDGILEDLSVNVLFDNINYSSNAKEIQHTNKILLFDIPRPFQSSLTFYNYITFPRLNIICRSIYYFGLVIHGQNCTGKQGNVNTICYHDPLLPSLLSQDFNWTVIENILNGPNGISGQLSQTAGYLFDTRQTMTTTIATTTTTTTTITTIITTTAVITTSAIVTTTAVTSITTATTITAITITTTTITSIVTTITNTASESIVTTSDSTTKTVTMMIDKNQKMITLTKPKQPLKNRSTTFNEHNETTGKKSSSKSIMIIVFILIFVLCLFGLILLFFLKSRQNKRPQHDSESHIDPIDDDQSQNTDVDDENDEETKSGPKGVRMMNRIGPNEF